MGPIALFDKSFLHNLNQEESILFDYFFNPMVCSPLYMEALANLNKPTKGGNLPQDKVQIRAKKYPHIRGVPCESHLVLVFQNLLGMEIPFRNIPIFSPKPIKMKAENKRIVGGWDISAAFARWVNKEFSPAERKVATEWEGALKVVNLEHVSKQLKAIGIDPKVFKTYADAKDCAEFTINQLGNSPTEIICACSLLHIPETFEKVILENWESLGRRNIADYAPYAAYLLKLELFFRFAVLNPQLFTSEQRKKSDLVDIAYLCYLPFCDIFISSDNLQMKYAPLFITADQQCIKGSEIKKLLKEINTHFEQLPEDIRMNGISLFAKNPPIESLSFLNESLNKYLPAWREKFCLKIGGLALQRGIMN